MSESYLVEGPFSTGRVFWCDVVAWLEEEGRVVCRAADADAGLAEAWTLIELLDGDYTGLMNARLRNAGATITAAPPGLYMDLGGHVVAVLEAGGSVVNAFDVDSVRLDSLPTF